MRQYICKLYNIDTYFHHSIKNQSTLEIEKWILNRLNPNRNPMESAMITQDSQDEEHLEITSPILPHLLTDTGVTTIVCCCGCGANTTSSHHFCSITGKRVMCDCYDDGQDLDMIEGFNSRAICRGCGRKQSILNRS